MTSELRRVSTPSDLAAYLADERARLLRGRRSLGGIGFMKAHSELIDAVIARIFELAVRETERRFGKLKTVLGGVCLAATGGYGRRELSPFSDVDVAFISATEEDPRADQLVKNAYRLLMDSFSAGTGLKVGYSYRRLGECRELPLDVHTSLLDAGYIAGSEKLFARFRREVRDTIAPAAFVIEHIEQRRLGAERWGDSVHRAEPNIKDGKGGLRDMQTARWITRVAFDVSSEAAWETLVNQGVLSFREAAEVTEALEFVSKARNSLHLVCGRANDVLSVDRRDAVARSLGFRSGAAIMRRYYAHAERISALWERAAAECLAQSLEIEPGVVARSGSLILADPSVLDDGPDAALRILGHAVRLRLNLATGTADLIRRYPRGGRLPKEAGRSFLRLLSDHDPAECIMLATETGILRRLVPEIHSAMREVPADAAHELTVGAHSLAAVRKLRGFVSGDDPDLREAWSGIESPDILYLATLLHDIGKASDAEDHCKAGEKIAVNVGERLGMSPDSFRELAFLVGNHLLMSETARLRDLSDYRAAEEVAEAIGSERILAMLYLLTAADLQSVGQSNWSAVQMRFLRELYHRALTVLRRTSEARPDMELHRSRLAREMSLANLPPEELDEHFGAMPAGYLLNSPPDELAAHIQYVRQVRAGEVVVALRDDPSDKLTEITICAPEDPSPGLLAKIAGALFILGVDIHAALVFTRETTDRIAIDILHADSDRRPLSELKKLQVESELSDLLSGRHDLGSLAARFGRSLGGTVIASGIEVASDQSGRHSMVQIRAEDRPGLLYCLTRAMASLGWNIHGARINTWGDEAQDVFHVTNKYGNRLDAASAIMGLRRALAAEE